MKKELEVDCHAIYRYAEANNKYMKNYNRNIWIIIPHLFRCKQFVWMGSVSKITGKWFWMGKNVSKFVEEFIKNCDEDSNKWYILEVEVEYPKDFIICIVIYHSYQKEWKLKNAISLYAICIIKKE